MPHEFRLALDEELDTQLEAVRQQQGLETLDQAAEWLARRRLRKGTASLTGRGRALYEIRGRSD
ncbi:MULTISPECIES: hypothetical protein [Halomonadaceae]|uniref:hypothetical protein n=1 Tax=Halomonadaceae TaxID=28256 RepID=UPI001CF51DDF|nr:MULTISPECIES: hypothetical protein [unclassified Halomonas]MCA8865580.1 hypothetical protein [Halomonas sp. SBBP1]UZH10438.1 hypothetical protein OM794_01340 [Halomonas sp. BDJS001]